MSEMIESSLAVARDSAPAKIDLDALVCEGKRLYRGVGMTEEDIQAFGLFLRAAMGGHSEAQYLVSRCYHWEHGAQLDEAQALDWLRKSAEAGFSEAQYWLGNAYSYGDGVLQDDGEAFKWYSKAAEQGNADAQRNLGLCYQCGDGVPNDEAKAAKWYRKAAEQGDPDAQCTLGYCYSVGQGVPLELMWHNETGGPTAYIVIADFNALPFRKHDEEVQLCAFDMLAVGGKDLRKLPLSMRDVLRTTAGAAS